MATPVMESFTAGAATAVDVARIDRQLHELWQLAADAEGRQITRACRFNFITYCESEADRDHVTGVIGQLTSRHPCRAIVLLARPGAAPAALAAAISAHCHWAGSGRKQVCCEQISIEAAGEPVAQLGTVALPLLESDLPTVLWWRGNFLAETTAFRSLVAVADRLIYHTGTWSEPERQLAALGRSLELHRRCAFTDLSWTRLDLWRTLIAESFDDPQCRMELAQLELVEIAYGRRPGVRVRALLLAGWLAAQLDWSPAVAATKLRLREENEDAGVTGITLRSARATFTVRKDLGERAASAWVEMPDRCGLPRKQAFLPGDDVTLLAMEFDRAHAGPAYQRALRLAAALAEQR
jgi:glucose-6-phosphate dehydrogenase assembly protein OpcA